MDVVVSLFPVTSTSLDVVLSGLFGFLYDALGSIRALFCVRFCHGSGGFCQGRRVGLVSFWMLLTSA